MGMEIHYLFCDVFPEILMGFVCERVYFVELKIVLGACGPVLPSILALPKSLYIFRIF